MDRRRFLKYAGATAAVVGASALGLDFLKRRPTSSQTTTTSTASYTLSALNLDTGRKLDGVLRLTREAMAESVLTIDPKHFDEKTTFERILHPTSHLHTFLNHYTESNGVEGVVLKASDLVAQLGMWTGDRDVLVATVTDLNSLSSSIPTQPYNGVLTALLGDLDSNIQALVTKGDPDAAAKIKAISSLFEKIVATMGFNAFNVSILSNDLAAITKAEIESLGLPEEHLIGAPYTFSDEFYNEPLIRRHQAFSRAMRESIAQVDLLLIGNLQRLTPYLQFFESSDNVIRKWARYGSMQELQELVALVGIGLDVSIFDFANDPFEFGRLAALLRSARTVPSVEQRLIEGTRTYGLRKMVDVLNYSRLQAIPLDNGETYSEVIADLHYADDLEAILSFDGRRYSMATTNPQNICPNSRQGATEIILCLKEAIKRRLAEKYNWAAILCMNGPPKYSGSDGGRSFRRILESLKESGSTTYIGATYFLMQMLLQYSNYISSLPGPVLHPFAFSHLVYSGKGSDAYGGVFVDQPLYHHDPFWLWYIGDNTFKGLRKNHGGSWAYSFSAGALVESFPILDTVLTRNEFAKYAPSWTISALSSSQ